MKRKGIRSAISLFLVIAMLAAFAVVPASAWSNEEAYYESEYGTNYYDYDTYYYDSFSGEGTTTYDSITVTVDSAFELNVSCCVCGDSYGWHFSGATNCTYWSANPGWYSSTATFMADYAGYDEIYFYCSDCGAEGYFDVTIKSSSSHDYDDDDDDNTKPGIYLSESNLIMNEDENTRLYCNQIHSRVATDLVWTTSDSSVVSVSAYGDSAVIYAGSSGQATITVKDRYSGDYDTCYVSVSGSSYSITVGKISSVTYSVGDNASALMCQASLYDSKGKVVLNPYLSYQWYYGSSSYSCNTPISGATDSYYYPSTRTAGTTYYACVVTYDVGSAHASSVTSPAAVVVNDNSYVLRLETSESSLDYGKSTTLTASVYTYDGYGRLTRVYPNTAVSFTVDNSSCVTLNDTRVTAYDGSASTKLNYSTASTSRCSIVVTAGATVNGCYLTDTCYVTLNAYSNNYSVVLSSSISSLSSGESAPITASVYQDSKLVANKNYTVTWYVNNANNACTLDSTSNYTSAGSASNTLRATMALAATRIVTVVAEVSIDGKIYKATKDFSICAVAGSMDITTVGTSFNAGAASRITSAVGSNGVYVTFTLPSASEGVLYYDRSTPVVGGSAVKSTDAFYLTAASGQKSMSTVYYLPAADCSGTVTIYYTVHNTVGDSISTGSISFNVTKQKISAWFTDVKIDWCADSVDFMATTGMVNGTSANTYSPYATMTRAQLITILYRAMGSPALTSSYNPFTDVPTTQYYHDAILWAYQNGYATPASSTTFGVNTNITREEIYTIMWKLRGSPASSYDLSSYADSGKVSASSLTAMRWACEKRYLRGNGTSLNPLGSATRAEVAVMLHRYFTE